MNKIFFTLAALAACSPAFAQEDSSFWRVYDTKTQQEENVEVPHLRSMAIVGKDDRQEITGSARGFEKATVVLTMQDANGNWHGCSGAMIGKNMVLTAAHCLTTSDNHLYRVVKVTATGLNSKDNQKPAKPKKPKHKGADKNKPANPKKSNKDSIADALKRHIQTDSASYDAAEASPQNTSFPSAKAVKLWVPFNWKNTSSKYDEYRNYDYGIIILDSNLGEKTGWFKIATKQLFELQYRDVIVLGRGRDKPIDTLWRSEGRIGSVLPTGILHHNADTLKGNSGGPIVLKEDPHTIIALNNFHQKEKGQGNYVPEGEYPNGGLCISEDIISAVNRNKTRK